MPTGYTAKSIGSIIIGSIAAVAGFPVFNFTTGVFSLKRLIVCSGCCFLWLIICSIAESK